MTAPHDTILSRAEPSRVTTCTRTASAAVAVAALLVISATASAQTTAAEVVDRPTLKAFVDGVKAEIESAPTIADTGVLLEKMRTLGDWRTEDTFLIIFSRTGEPFVHAGDRTAETKNLRDVVDDNGFMVVQALLAAGPNGAFVDYHVGEPKAAYAVQYTTRAVNVPFVLVGGYSQDVSHVPLVMPDLPTPRVTAQQVKDRESLVIFVEEAIRVFLQATVLERNTTITGVKNVFRVEGGDWRSGSTYLWLISDQNIILFQAPRPHREGLIANLETEDIHGVKFAEELINGARRDGHRFLKYYYDDPTVDGDEDTGSPKLGYAKSFDVPRARQRFVMGSGLYLRTGCYENDTTLCLLDDRYEVTAQWYTADDRGAARVAGHRTTDSGLIYFFDPNNWEMLVKVLNGCHFNQHHWVFAASATDVGFNLTVRDTSVPEGMVKRYTKMPGEPARAITDTGAFAHCTP